MDARGVTFPKPKTVTDRLGVIRERLKEVDAHLAAHKAILNQRQREFGQRPKIAK